MMAFFAFSICLDMLNERVHFTPESAIYQDGYLELLFFV